MMKLKTIAFSAMLALCGGAAHAQVDTTAQTCAPLEVNHSGATGLTFRLACEAGPWKLRYSGPVPAGSGEVPVAYQLDIDGPAGQKITQARVARLPTPALLAQVLVREAVLHADLTLALRACKELNCGTYAPLGSATADAGALPSEHKLRGTIERLEGDLAQRMAQLAQQKATADGLAAEVERLQAEVLRASSRLDMANAPAAGGLVTKAACDAKVQELAQVRAALATAEAAMAEREQAFKLQGATLLSRSSEVQRLQDEVADLNAQLLQARQAHTAAQGAQVTVQGDVAQLQADLGAARTAMALESARLRLANRLADQRQTDLDQLRDALYRLQRKFGARTVSAALKLDQATTDPVTAQARASAEQQTAQLQQNLEQALKALQEQAAAADQWKAKYEQASKR